MRLTRTTLKELSKKYRAVLNRCLLISMVLGITHPALAETETIPSPAPAHGYYLEKISDVVPGTIEYGHVALDGKYYVIKGTFGHNEGADHIAYYKWDTSAKKLVEADSASADIVVKHYDTATRLENLTENVLNKAFKGITSIEYGGAIYNSSTNGYNITNTDFISNISQYKAGNDGGAIYNNRNAKIDNITGDFISNSTQNGGAIFNESYATIGSITGDFISNSVTGSSASGGAIYNFGTIDTLTGDFISNFATGDGDVNGGAICNGFLGKINIVANDQDIKFEGNTATQFGGAIYNSKYSTYVGTIGLYAQAGKNISFIGDSSNEETDSIYNEGILNIGGTHNSVNYTGTVSLQKLDNLGEINVNGGTAILNKVDGSSGTININGGTVILNNTVENNTLNLNSNGTLKIPTSDFTISAPIHSNKGTLDLKNNAITTTTINNLTGTLNVLVDVDLSASQMDKLNIDTITGGVLIQNINLMGTTQQNSLTLDFVNSETFVSSAINNISYNGENYSVIYDYSTGRLILTKTSALPTPIKKTQDNGVASSVSTNTVVSSVINANRMVYQSRPFSSVSGKKNVQGKSGGDKSQYGLWVEGLYNVTERDSNNADFDAHTKAIAMGLDHQITDSVLAGMGYSYSQSDVKADGTKSDTDTHSVFVYGQYKPKSYFVMGSVGYAFSKTESKVQNTEDYNSNAFFADALVGKEYGLFTPNAGLRYSFVRQDNYKMNGMSVKSKNAQTLTGVVGTQLKLSSKNITGTFSVNALYDLKSENNSVTINRTTTIETKKLSRFGIEAGAGVQAQLSNHWSLNVDYVGEFREHYKSNTGIVSVKYDF